MAVASFSYVNQQGEHEVSVVRIGIIDDDANYRRLVRAMLEEEDDFEIVGEADDGSEALDLIDRVELDLIVMDAQMPSMSGFEATRLISQLHPEVKVVLVSRTGNIADNSRLAAEVGTTIFVSKDNLDVGVIRRALQI